MHGRWAALLGLGLFLSACGSSHPAGVATPDPQAAYKASAKNLTYYELAQGAPMLVGTRVTYVGQVFQYDAVTTPLHMKADVNLNASDYHAQIVWLDVTPTAVVGLAKDSWIRFWGSVMGNYSYALPGGTAVAPEVKVKYIEAALEQASPVIDEAAYKASASVPTYDSLVADAKGVNYPRGTVVTYVGQITPNSYGAAQKGRLLVDISKPTDQYLQLMWLDVNATDVTGLTDGMWVRFWGEVEYGGSWTGKSGTDYTVPEVQERFIEKTTAPA
jgi:hypothetical protein